MTLIDLIRLEMRELGTRGLMPGAIVVSPVVEKALRVEVEPLGLELGPYGTLEGGATLLGLPVRVGVATGFRVEAGGSAHGTREGAR